MNRRKWWTALLAACGVAKAQTIVWGSTRPEDCDRLLTKGNWDTAKTRPRNNECPVCGTMAKPYKRPLETEVFGADTCLVREGASMANLICSRAQAVPYGPTTNRVTCEWCKCVFEQSEEV